MQVMHIIATGGYLKCAGRTPGSVHMQSADSTSSILNTPEKGYPEKVNPGPYRAPFPRF